MYTRMIMLLSIRQAEADRPWFLTAHGDPLSAPLQQFFSQGRSLIAPEAQAFVCPYALRTYTHETRFG